MRAGDNCRAAADARRIHDVAAGRTNPRRALCTRAYVTHALWSSYERIYILYVRKDARE